MSVWSFLGTVLDWVLYWDAYVRGLFGLVLAVIVGSIIPFDSLRIAAQILAFLFAMIVQIQWNPLRVTLPMPKWVLRSFRRLFLRKHSVAPSPAFRSNDQRKVSDFPPA